MAGDDTAVKIVTLPLTLQEALTYRLANRLGDLAAAVKALYAGNPMGQAIVGLLYDFGFFAPLADYHPPLGAVLTHTNLIVRVPAGATEKKVCLPTCSTPGYMRKYKSIVVTPLNVAAEDYVTMVQRIIGPQFGMKWLTTAACSCVGDFSTYANLYIPCKPPGLIEFIFANSGSNEARLQIEADSWLG